MSPRKQPSRLGALLRLLSPRSRAERRGAAGEAQVSRTLRRAFTHVADDLILPDGRGGLTQIDHLVLTPNGLLVIETKNYRGLVFGRMNDPNWTQVVGRQRHRFQSRAGTARGSGTASLPPVVGRRSRTPPAAGLRPGNGRRPHREHGGESTSACPGMSVIRASRQGRLAAGLWSPVQQSGSIT